MVEDTAIGADSEADSVVAEEAASVVEALPADGKFSPKGHITLRKSILPNPTRLPHRAW